jgi:hypothetical protein
MNLPTDSGIAVVADKVRKAHLDLAVQQEILAGGRLEARGEVNAVIVIGQPVNHALHGVVTLLTGGFWVLAWIMMGIANHNTHYFVTLSIDEYGNLVREHVKPQAPVTRYTR